MKLYVPKLGDILELSNKWEPKVYYEYRNSSVLYAYLEGNLDNNKFHYSNRDSFEKIIFPSGTKLRVDRIYIRKGAGNFDSITFVIEQHPHNKEYNKKRFWVKLDDANNIEFDMVVPVKRIDINFINTKNKSVDFTSVHDPSKFQLPDIYVKSYDVLNLNLTSSIIYEYVYESTDNRFIINSKHEIRSIFDFYTEEEFENFCKLRKQYLNRYVINVLLGNKFYDILLLHRYELVDTKTNKTYYSTNFSTLKSKAKQILKSEII